MGGVPLGRGARVRRARRRPAPADPALPAALVPEGATPYLRTHAVGTQNYVCVATGSGLAWRFVGPQATLFVSLVGFQQQATTHFLSPNPEEAGLARATWQGSFDSSRVWARAMQIVDDPAIVGAGNIPWLLLQRAGGSRGPTGGSLALTHLLDPADPHRGRRRAGHRLQRIHPRRSARARALQHRLCLLSLISEGVRTRPAR